MLGAVDKNIPGALDAIDELIDLIGAENQAQANDLTDTLYQHIGDPAKIPLLTRAIDVPVVPPLKSQAEIQKEKDLNYIKGIANILKAAEKVPLPASCTKRATSPAEMKKAYADFITWLNAAHSAKDSLLGNLVKKQGDNYLVGSLVIQKKAALPEMAKIINQLANVKGATSALAVIYNILPEADRQNFIAQAKAAVIANQPKPLAPPIPPVPPVQNPLQAALQSAYDSMGGKLKSLLKALYTQEIKKNSHTLENNTAQISHDDKIISSLKEEAADIISYRVKTDKDTVKNELTNGDIFNKILNERFSAIIANNFSVGLMESKITAEKNHDAGKRNIKYGGIGADVSYDAEKGGLLINCLISDHLPEDKKAAAQKNLPAYKAGLRANDVITGLYFTREQLQSLSTLANQPEAKDLKEALEEFDSCFKQPDANGLYKLSLSGLDKKQADLACVLCRGMPGSTLLYEVAGRDKPIVIEREIINAKPQHCCVQNDKNRWQDKTAETGNHGRVF